jgi:hypothetical protein
MKYLPSLLCCLLAPVLCAAQEYTDTALLKAQHIRSLVTYIVKDNNHPIKVDSSAYNENGCKVFYRSYDWLAKTSVYRDWEYHYNKQSALYRSVNYENGVPVLVDSLVHDTANRTIFEQAFSVSRNAVLTSKTITYFPNEKKQIATVIVTDTVAGRDTICYYRMFDEYGRLSAETQYKGKVLEAKEEYVYYPWPSTQIRAKWSTSSFAHQPAPYSTCSIFFRDGVVEEKCTSMLNDEGRLIALRQTTKEKDYEVSVDYAPIIPGENTLGSEKRNVIWFGSTGLKVRTVHYIISKEQQERMTAEVWYDYCP